MQEFYLATEEPVWYWGSTDISNAVLKRDMPLLMTASWDLYGTKEVESWIPGNVETSTGKPIAQFSAEISRISDVIARRKKTHGFDIPSRLYRNLSAKATDPRDLVYGLREIFDPVFRRIFVPDYFMKMELLYVSCSISDPIRGLGRYAVVVSAPFSNRRPSELVARLYKTRGAS